MKRITKLILLLLCTLMTTAQVRMKTDGVKSSVTIPNRYKLSSLGALSQPYDYGYIDNVRSQLIYTESIEVKSLGLAIDNLVPNKHNISSIGEAGSPFQSSYVIIGNYTDVNTELFNASKNGLMSSVIPAKHTLSNLGSQSNPYHQVNATEGIFTNLITQTINTANDNLRVGRFISSNFDLIIMGELYNRVHAIYTNELNSLNASIDKMNISKDVLRVGLMLPNKYNLPVIGSASDRYDGYFGEANIKKLITKVENLEYKYDVEDYYPTSTDDYYSGVIKNQKPDNRLTGITTSKEGGIYFRGDDYPSNYAVAPIIHRFIDTNTPYLWAVNIGSNSTAAEIEYARMAEAMGIELADHTPNHSQLYYNRLPIPSTNDGIDTLIGENYYLDYSLVADYLITADSVISGDIVRDEANDRNLFVTNDNGALGSYSSTYLKMSAYKITSGINAGDYRIKGNLINDTTGYLYNSDNANPDTLVLKSWYIYNDDVIDTLTAESNVAYQLIHEEGISLKADGLRRLVEASNYWRQKNNISKVKTWVYSGGGTAEVYIDTAALVFPEYNITSSAVAPQESPLTYNYYENNAPYSMQWGAFKPESENYNTIITKIADDVAKHKVLGGSGHFLADEAFHNRLDSIIVWANRVDIKIAAQSEWADILYRAKADPYINIIPALHVDKDGNGRPDGYTLDNNTTWASNGGQAEWSEYELQSSTVDTIFVIDDLGGLEKGTNNFRVYAKGADGDSVHVWVNASTGTDTDFGLSLSASYEYYDNDVVIDYDATYADIRVQVISTNGTVHIGYMEFKKK